MSDRDLETRLRSGFNNLPSPPPGVADRVLDKVVAGKPRRRRLRTWTGRVAAVGVAAALVATIAFLIVAVPDDAADPGSPTATDALQVAPTDRPKAPDVTFKIIDPGMGGSPVKGPTLALRDLRGDVVVIALMASWCTPCRGGSPETFDPKTTTDMPMTLQYLSVMESRGVRGLGVAVRDLETDARKLRQHGPTFDGFPLAVDPDGAAADALGARGGFPR